MCTVGDDNIDDLESQKYMPQIKKLSLSGKCNKCREQQPCVVLRAKDKYCKECFLAGTTHKFKALLGKHKLIRPNERVLIAHNCGQVSTALLHLVRTGLDLATHKKLRFHAEVLFIEKDLHLNVEERRGLLANVEKEAKNFDFCIHFAKISDILAENLQIYTDSASIPISNDDPALYLDYFKQYKNKSKKNDLFNIILRKAHVEIGKKLGFSFIFTTETSSDVASQLLSDISLGRGAQVPLNAGFCDDRSKDVKIVRPLRLFDAKEVAFYNYFHNLTPVSYRMPQINNYESIQSLMRKFIADLQVNYPATVTTVLKTGDKLDFDKKSGRKCEMCQAFITDSNDKKELSSSESTEFSHTVSTTAPNYTQTPQNRYQAILDSFTQNNRDTFCFSCRKLIL